MTINKALDRLTWRFEPRKDRKPKTITINNEDVEALNRVIEHVNDAREAALNSNRGFAKLYTTVFCWQLEKFQLTPMDDYVQIQLHRLLDQPLDYFYQRAHKTINEIETNLFLKEHNFETGKHPLQIPEEKKKAEAARLYELLKDEANNARFTGTVWNEEDVQTNLESMISEALIKYKL